MLQSNRSAPEDACAAERDRWVARRVSRDPTTEGIQNKDAPQKNERRGIRG